MSAIRKLSELLVDSGVVTYDDMVSVVDALAPEERNLSEYLCHWGYASDGDVVQAISRGLKIPKVGVETAEPDPDALRRLSAKLCAQYLILPVEIMSGKAGNQLVLAMANPLDVEAIQAAARLSDLKIKPFVASARELRHAIGRCYEVDVPSGVDGQRLSPRFQMDDTQDNKTDKPGRITPDRRLAPENLFDEPEDLLRTIFNQKVSSRREILEVLNRARLASDSYRDRLLYTIAHHLIDSKQIDVKTLLHMLLSDDLSSDRQTS